MALRDQILAAQEAAIKAPWSHRTDPKPVMIQFSDRIYIGLSLNK
jgi:hypothetical protein